MPDIAKCKGTGCPLKDRCYRFVSDPTPMRQAFLLGVPYGKVEPNVCNFLMLMGEVEDGLRT